MDVLATNKKLYVFALAFSYLKLVQNDLKVIFYLCKNCFDIFQVWISKNKLLKLITLPPDFAKTKFTLSLESLIFNIRFLYIHFVLFSCPFNWNQIYWNFLKNIFYPCVGVMTSCHVTRAITKMPPSFFSILIPWAIILS